MPLKKDLLVWKEHPVYGILYGKGVELFRQGFLLVQGHAYKEFTSSKDHIPRRVSVSWDAGKKSITIVPAEDEEEGTLAFTDESVQNENPKPRGRIRIKSVFRAVGIRWPEEIFPTSDDKSGKRKAIHIPYQVTPGRLELFLGEAFDNLGYVVNVSEQPRSLVAGEDVEVSSLMLRDMQTT